MKTDLFKNLKYDAPAGLVVFLVAVPLCLGIALASGAPLFSGIIAGMVGGIVVTSFSGSQLGVSGPAAGLAVIVLTAIQELGAFETFLMAVVIGGVVQIGLGIARAGIIGYYFPSSVIKGMLSAIGIIIFLKQIPHAFGYDADFEGDLGFVQADGENTFSELINMVNYITPGAILISSLSLLILILWERPFMKRIKLFQIVQGPLIVVAMGIILAMVFTDNNNLALNPSQMVSIPVADDLQSFVGLFTLPDFSQLLNGQVWVVGVTIAVVASLETLLCVEATDKLDPQKRVTPTNQELRAQGIGNLVSGLIGGLPVTQVIVRSSANIQSGGKSKASALIHGFLILISALIIPNVLNMIPLSSLAAILLVVGYKLAKPSVMKQIYNQGWNQFIPFAVTVLAIVFTDLLQGIGIGLAVAIFHILINNYRNPYIAKRKDDDQTHIRLVLSENVTFLNKGKILRVLSRIPNDTELFIDASKSVHIDHDVLEIINDFKESAKHRNIDLKICCLDHLELNGYEDSLRELIVSEQEIQQMPKEKELEIA